MDQAQFQRLPAYARNAWAALLSRCEAAERKLAALTGGEETRVQIDPYTRYMNGPKEAPQPARYLPNHETIRFSLDGGKVDARMAYNDAQWVLEIFSDAWGRGDLVIKPGAANHFTIAFATNVKE